DVEAFAHTRGPLTTYESGMPVGDADIIAVSIAYEMEITALLRCLDLSGMPLLASDRGEGYPLVVMGGPLTFSNILPAAPFADVVIMGEGEEVVLEVVGALHTAHSREQFFDTIEGLSGVYLPARHGEQLRPVAKAADETLPAYSVIRTPHTELSD